MMRIKKLVFSAATIAALSSVALTAGCGHMCKRCGSGPGAGGATGTGSGGTIDSGGSRMDQGSGSPGTDRPGNGSGAGY